MRYRLLGRHLLLRKQVRLPERAIGMQRYVRQHLHGRAQLRRVWRRMRDWGHLLFRSLCLSDGRVGVQRRVRQHVDKYEQLRDLRNGLRDRRGVHERHLHLWKQQRLVLGGRSADLHEQLRARRLSRRSRASAGHEPELGQGLQQHRERARERMQQRQASCEAE